MCEFSFQVEQISSPTWLSSFSAAILILGSIVPLRACIILLGSMCVEDFFILPFLTVTYAFSPLLFCYRFTQTFRALHFGPDPQTRLTASALKCSWWKGFIAESCHHHRLFLFKSADLRRTVAKIANLNVKQSTFTTLIFFFADRGNSTAT